MLGHGSNPAHGDAIRKSAASRSAEAAVVSLWRARSFPNALNPESGRDVGFAKSGFRPSI
jgi:hypothetical protein